MKKYFKLWWKMTSYTTQIAFQSRFGAVVFLLGKLMRFFFFLLFLYVIGSKTKAIGGYDIWQIIFFYATFNLLDSLPQFFLREVYRFRTYVVKGFFDYILTKPINPLFRSLFGGSDVFDLFILALSIIFVVVSASHMSGITFTNSILYFLLLINGFFIAVSFHIFVLGIGIISTAVDNTIMLYRDLTQMGRLPIDIYKEPLRGLITFIVPVGIMMTYPAKALMGLLSIQTVLLSFLVGGILFIASLQFWKFSLKQYVSASS